MDVEAHLNKQQANEIIESKDHEEIPEDPVRLALHEWQKAATAWTDLYRRINLNTNSTKLEQEKKLRKLEKRLNKAADNYEKAKSSDDWFEVDEHTS